MYLEGAAWDDENGVLRESAAKVIYTPMPIIHFVPVYLPPPDVGLPASSEGLPSADPSRDMSSLSQIGAPGKPDPTHSMPAKQAYACPAYKTSARAGVLLTTGHSTNFIQMIDLPTYAAPSHWVKRSVALLSQLDQ